MAVCPAFLATGREELSPRAKHLVFAVLRDEPERLDLKPARELADRCLACGRCANVCPQGLSAPRALADLRARHPNWQQWLWRHWIGQGRLLWPALAQASRLAPGATVPEGLRHMLRSAAAMLPPPPPSPWIVASRTEPDTPCRGSAQPQPRLRGANRHATGDGAGDGAEDAARADADRPLAMLFAGCTARRIRPRWKATARALLHRLGHPAPTRVIHGETAFSCCGATLEHAGIPDAAAAARARNLDTWRAAGRPLLVTFCATCHHGLAHYPDHSGLHWQEGEREAWAAALRPLSRLLAGPPSSPEGTAAFRVTAHAPAVPEGHAPAPVRYHQPCHRTGADPDAAWLRSVLGARMHAPGGVHCCGMGGVLQLAAPDLSRTVADACWKALLPEHTAAPEAPRSPDLAVLTGCSGCTVQLAATTPHNVRVLHWLDVVGLP